MSLETLARPYAQAIFDHSEGWGKDLDQMESVIKDSKVQNLINSPDLAYKQKTEAFISLFAGEVEEKTIKFIEVLGDAKRLSLIPDINLEYKKLVAEKNNSTDVLITSAYPLSSEQLEAISNKLKKRYGENISVTTEEDASLMGGFLVRSGDEVTDYTIKGKLEKLVNQIR